MKKSILLFCVLIMAVSAMSQVKTGIEVLRDSGFSQLKGKRVGLITNPTGVDRNLMSTIDILYDADSVELVALFAPEHGVRGNVAAGVAVSASVDKKTGIKVYSLYGKTKKPTKAMLSGLDALVYDIQDIGCRSYTFISTMGKAMEACAENNVEFIVLDRPNPLGGEKVEGCLVDSECVSFVSQYQIPYIYGLTAGELATMLNEEGFLRNGVKANLTVVEMQGWHRNMTWEETGLPWVLTSPHIPQPISAVFYPASGILGELDYMSIGVGYTLPFQVFCSEWVDASELTEKLNFMEIPGWKFRPVYIKPRYGLFSGKNLQGVQPYCNDYDSAELTLLQFYVMEAVAELYPLHKPFKSSTTVRLKSFDNVCGSKSVRRTFTDSGYKVESIREMWFQSALEFKKRSIAYYRYP